MKIGILGSGTVGKDLAKGFIKNGYQVMVGSRSPEKLEPWKEEISDKLQTGDFKETAAFGEVIVLATKGTITSEVIKMAGVENFTNKTVMDATNPIADEAPTNGVLKFFTNLDESLMEQLMKVAPKAHFVKAFSSVGSPLMVEPKFESKPTMFICGNDEESKKVISKIIDQFGWEPEDMGKAEAARAIEPLCMLWCIPGMLENKWMHAFKLLKK